MHEILSTAKNNNNCQNECNANTQQTQIPYYQQYNRRLVSTNHHNQQRKLSTNSINFNQNNTQYKQPPFQPPTYHHHHHNNHHNHHHHGGHNHNHHHNHFHNHQQQQHGQIIDKYNRKCNLVSFILLRKYDEYLNDETFYLNDQYLYQTVQKHIENNDLNSLKKLFEVIPNDEEVETKTPSYKNTLSNFINSYNCNLFVYIIRESLDQAHKIHNIKLNGSSSESNFYKELIEFLLKPDLMPENCLKLIDGDYPMRNLMHHAAQYDCSLLVDLFKQYDKDDLLANLCLTSDFNGNSPVHIAAQFNSIEFLKTISSEIVKTLDSHFNNDGLNPLLIACRHSSLDFVKYLIETCGCDIERTEKNNNVNKNCLHMAVLRHNSLDIVKYLYQLKPNLAYEQSPLVGTVFHIATSHLTRLDALWYLLNGFNSQLDTPSSRDNNSDSNLNKYDFRQLSTADSFIDTLINIRELVPADTSVYKFFANIYENSSEFKNEYEFNLLIKKCLFLLLNKLKAKIYALPRIKTITQLIEFLKLLVFMSKFNVYAQFDSVYFKNFEAFCLKFLNTYIFCGDLIIQNASIQTSPAINDQNNNNLMMRKIQSTPTFNTSIAAAASVSTTATTLPSNEQHLFLIYNELVELTRILVLSGRYTIKFQNKIYSFMRTYLHGLYQTRCPSSPQSTTATPSTSLPQTPISINNNSNNSSLLNTSTDCNNQSSTSLSQTPTPTNSSQSFFQSSFLNIKYAELCSINRYQNVLSLKELCRIEINQLLFTNRDDSDVQVYMKLPRTYYSLVNYLTFDLIHDLFGDDVCCDENRYKFDINNNSSSNSDEKMNETLLYEKYFKLFFNK